MPSKIKSYCHSMNRNILLQNNRLWIIIYCTFGFSSAQKSSNRFCFLLKGRLGGAVGFQRLSTTQIVLEGFGPCAKTSVLLMRTRREAAWTVVTDTNCVKAT